MMIDRIIWFEIDSKNHIGREYGTEQWYQFIKDADGIYLRPVHTILDDETIESWESE